MKPAFQKEGALLADIAAARARMLSRLWWLGQSGFLVLRNGRALVFDPYLSDSLTRKYANTDKPHVRLTERVIAPATLGALGCIDVITSSHQHTDHLDAETLQPLLAANPQARLVIPAANRDFVVARLGRDAEPRLVELNAGVSATVGDLEVHGIPAAHNTVERDAFGRCRFLGYVVCWHGLTLYHSGDTLWDEELIAALRRFRVDVALLPINGNRPERRVAGNLNGREAAQLAATIKARWALPCHFDLFAFNTAAPDEFVSECRRLDQPCVVLRNGEGWTIPDA